MKAFSILTSDIKTCPQRSLLASHYREDGSCLCGSGSATVQVIVDGMAWREADGTDRWPRREAAALAEALERQGYDDVEVTA